eukprot:2688007-Alexandrium_andersonii.AAC.1
MGTAVGRIQLPEAAPCHCTQCQAVACVVVGRFGPPFSRGPNAPSNACSTAQLLETALPLQ